MKKKATAKRYSEAFKRQVVRDLEKGVTTVAEVRRRYGITGAMTIPGWLKRYGKGIVKKASGKKAQQVVESRRFLVLERQKRELEQALTRITVEKTALESLIEEAESHLGIDLKKTFGSGR